MRLNSFRAVLFAAITPLLPGGLFANDGVFYASGNTLIPVKETVVRLDKEILGLTRDGEYVNVSVYFEFFNPGPEKEEIVGFVTPPGGGDFPEEEAAHPQISRFTVEMNNQQLEWKVFVMDQSGFSLPDTIAGTKDFIYHFRAKFKNGLNIIRHTYRFRAASGVETEWDVPYVITTGKMWANGEIGDFTLKVDMGPDSYFSVPWNFNSGEANAGWKIEGKGRLAQTLHHAMDSKLQVVAIQQGILSLHQVHFKPDMNLDVVVWPLHNEVYLWRDDGNEHEFGTIIWFYLIEDLTTSGFYEATDEQLRLLRNYFYARRGYAFTDKTLRNYFARFNWYFPDPSLKMDKIVLDEKEAAMVAKIKAEEARRKAAQK